MVNQSQRNHRSSTPRPAPQFAERERCNQHDEEIEQRPLCDPRTGRLVHAAGRNQVPARWQVQLGRDRLEVFAPAGGAQGAAIRFEAAIGHDVGRTVAHFHARALLGVGDELVLSVDRSAPERRRRGHVEPPAAMDRAADAIAHGVAAAVEIEPDVALQVEVVGRRFRIAAFALGQLQRLARFQAKCRQGFPFIGHADQLGIDRRAARRRDHAQGIVRLKYPYLVLGQGRRCCRQGDAGLRRHLARRHRQLPMAGAHLHAQPAVGFQPCRQLARQ